jgi:hypothetical protein
MACNAIIRIGGSDIDAGRISESSNGSVWHKVEQDSTSESSFEPSTWDSDVIAED